MSDLHDPTSRHVVRDDETQLSSKHPWSSQETSLGTRKRWPRIWPVLLLDVSTSNGSITSDFPTIRVTTDPTTHAAQAHGDVSQGGDAPKLRFALTTDNGAVRIHKT